MVEKIAVILNAYGGKLGAKAKIARVEAGMQAAGLEYHLHVTQYPDHGKELAQQAALNGCSIVVAAGGDGTINEVVNGLMPVAVEHSPEALPCTLGILPLGTANDLADMLNLPRDITAACRCLAKGNTRLIDVGYVNGRYFANNSAVGLEPIVTINHDKMRRVKGDLRYVLAAIKTIIQSKSWDMRLDWDCGVYEGQLVIVSVGNSARTGGAFFMTPQAEVDDGLLDFVFASNMSRLKMLTVFPLLFRGKHIGHPKIVYLKTRKLIITSTHPTPIQTDGEIIDEAATKIEYCIIPQKLPVII